MAETSIEWTSSIAPDGRRVRGYTFNPWWGCVKISPACTFCYAATLAARFGTAWGLAAQRRFAGDAYWNEPRRWNRKAEKTGTRSKVFCASMADVFELLPTGHPNGGQMDAERARLWRLIEETPALDWLLLTKRPENILAMIPPEWRLGVPSHVWMGATVEAQNYLEERIPALLAVPARVRFLSCEPLRGPLSLAPFLGGEAINWVLAGGESGPKARPHDPDWFRALRDQCIAAGVPFHFKQHGCWVDPDNLAATGCVDPAPYRKTTSVGRQLLRFVDKKKAGRMLDGRTWDEMPGEEGCARRAPGRE